ncbi:MAG: hypothetical protein ABSE91_02135 [Patescibacteria group bacterium]|jgi:hypothetical protein
MIDDYDKIEEELKQKGEPKKKEKVSGRSIFKIQEIIKKKAESSDETGEVEKKDGHE